MGLNKELQKQIDDRFGTALSRQSYFRSPYSTPMLDKSLMSYKQSLISYEQPPSMSAPDPIVVERSQYVHCSHNARTIKRKEADECIEELCAKMCSLDFDTIAFRGISGTIIAPIIAHKLNKEMILVRKNKGNNCASGRWMEGYTQAKRYVIIDDLIYSGNSVIDTIHAVKALTADKAELVAVCLYDDYSNHVVDIIKHGEASQGSTSFNRMLERAHERYVAGQQPGSHDNDI